MINHSRQASAQAGAVRSIDDPLANDVNGGTAAQRVQAIIARCAHRHAVSVADITGRSRQRVHVNARYEAIALVARAFPAFSTPHLGTIFGNRDHTSILHALGKTTRGADTAKRRK